MTVMRTSIYAILAVIVGVMLVGMLPNQLSNLATSSITKPSDSLQGASSPGQLQNRNLTSPTYEGTKTDSGISVERTNPGDPYLNLRYYSLWGVGLVIAVVAYFAMKRTLG